MEDGIDQLSVNDYNFIGDLQWVSEFHRASEVITNFTVVTI